MANFHESTFKVHDDYMTPKDIWQDISHFLPKDSQIWEPFYGDGSSAKHLRDLGCKDVIHEPIDFFDNNLGDVIVTNIPFSKSKEVLNRLYELDKPFIIIMPVSKLNTSYMRKWHDRNLQFIIPPKRMNFIKLVNGVPTQNKSSCNFDCYYYCYKMNLPKTMNWLPERPTKKSKEERKLKLLLSKIDKMKSAINNKSEELKKIESDLGAK